MEEIQVGEFVRTDKGNIGKIKEIRIGKNEETNTYQNIYILDNGLFTIIDYIVKHSFNLINLIEKNDYVNGYKVDFVQNNEVVYNHNHPYKLNMFAKDIKSIVTHEQFSSLEYKVEEK